MELKDFANFQRNVEHQARGIAEQFTKDQKTLMSYFVNSNQELLCISHISAVIPKHEDYNKVLTQLVSFGLLVETDSNEKKVYKKGRFFFLFENYFRK